MVGNKRKPKPGDTHMLEAARFTLLDVISDGYYPSEERAMAALKRRVKRWRDMGGIAWESDDGLSCEIRWPRLGEKPSTPVGAYRVVPIPVNQWLTEGREE